MQIPASWKFPALIALVLVVAEMGVALLIAFSAPPGTRWLGDTIANPSDVAVYISYVRQGADEHALLHDLYAIEPNAARFDLVWSTLGVIARAVPPVFAHELARWLFTILLVFAIHAAARQLTNTEPTARIATVLAVAGVTQGWLVSIYLTLTHSWSWSGSTLAPDVATEFAVAPILWGGAHVILSLALLITGFRFLWQAIETSSRRATWFAMLALAALFCFHPYFVPLVAVFGCIALISLRRHLTLKKISQLVVPGIVCALPALAIYAPLALDPVFRTHHLVANVLELASPEVWLIVLLPFLGALAWRATKRITIQPRERWVFTWILATLITLLFPFPWKRKLTEGLDVALVFATLPAWVALWQRLTKNRTTLSWLNACLLVAGASLIHFHLLTSQLAWLQDPEHQAWFYQPNTVFAAWEIIHHKTPTDAVVVTDDQWLNLWTPAETDRHVFTGHDHETPNFAIKQQLWGSLGNVTTTADAERILDEMHATTLLFNSPTTSQRLVPLLPTEWRPIYRSGTTIVLERQTD